MELDERYLVSSIEALHGLYDPPSERALLKQIDALDEHCRAFISRSPFLLLATSGRSGTDCSPRGDVPGFVEVPDPETLLIPDRRGNNRIDSLVNVVGHPAVGLIFLIPGVAETLRVNGRARISCDPDLLERFRMRGNVPATVLVVSVDEVFMQCSRAIVRSALWDPAAQRSRAELATLGTILAAHTRGRIDADAYDSDAQARVAQTLY